MSNSRWSLVLTLCTTVVCAFAEPSVTAVGNAASVRAGLTNSRLAPGAWMSIRGKELGPTTAVYGDAPANELGGSSVQIVTSGGAQFDAPLIFAAGGELLVRVPANVPAGEASVTIRAASGTKADAAKFTVVPSNFAVFTANLNDDAAAVFLQFRTGGFYYLNELNAPLKPGDEVNLWGTGLGADDAPLTILINDKAAEIVAKSKGESGLDRVRVKVPADVDGCGLPVFAKTGDDAAAAVGMLSVASDSRVCLDRGGFTPADIDKAQSAGGLKAAYLFLMRYGAPGGGGAVDIGFANFSRVSYELIRGFRSNWSQTIPGACYAANTDGDSNSFGAGMPGADFFDDFYPFGETPLDAGPMIDVRGPGGPQQMQKAADGIYTGFFFNMTNPTVSYFAPGDYTLSGNGPGTGSFSAPVKIGAPVTFTGVPAMATVNRGQDYEIRWTGGAPGDRVWVAGYSVELNGFTFARAGMVSCYALAQNGKLTIPSSALQFLPASSQPGMGFLMLYSAAAPQRFQPTGGLDAGYVLSLSYSAASASFQ